METTIRPACEADAESLQRTCWPDQFFFDVETRLLDVTIRNKRGLAWGVVAELNGEAVGYGQLGRWGRRCEISDLVVTAPLRGCGIGTAIIIALLDIARCERVAEVEIGAALSNPRALALYRRLGFHDKRRVDIDLGHGPEPVIYLSMALLPTIEQDS